MYVPVFERNLNALAQLREEYCFVGCDAKFTFQMNVVPQSSLSCNTMKMEREHVPLKHH
jgi:hypothetical protein